MEEERRRRSNKKLEIQDLLQDVNNKIITVEKANSRLVSFFGKKDSLKCDV